MLLQGIIDMPSKTPSEKMHDYRSRLRASGLRPVQIWVPDTHAENFTAEAKRQSVLVSGRANEDDALDFIETVADMSDS